MKKTLSVITTALACSAMTIFAHSERKLGPNGGRVLEFSKDQSMHGEVVEKDGQFHIVLLDKEMKPVPVEQQELSVTTGDRAKPEKLAVEKRDGKFVVPVQQGADYWLIFQYRQTAEAKPVTARLHYETKKCPTCNKAEWLCDCHTTEKK